jgi:alpha-galactosidase
MNRLCFGCVILLFTVASSPALDRIEIGQTPPMGWNSWNYHGKRRINEQVVLDTIDAMVDHGLRDAGYHYVVIDGGWRDKHLDPNGQLVPHPTKFPNGIKVLADYAHARGLKLGLHTVPGSHDCGGDAVGGFGHEAVHMRQFVEWGIDFLKIDKCGLRKGWDEDLLKATYEKWADLIAHSDRAIVLSVSAYKWRDWYPQVCQMSRTTLDIHCRIHKGGAAFDNATPYSVMSIATKNNAAAGFAGNGYWNDPDMIITGDHGLNYEEQKSHFALWCIMSAPLILGNDPRNMTPEEKAIILNADCIAIDQDPTEQGRRIEVNGAKEIWAKKMENGRVAVLLLNRSAEKTLSLTLNGSAVGLSGLVTVRDVYGKKDLGVLDSPITRPTPPHGCQFFVLSASRE